MSKTNEMRELLNIVEGVEKHSSKRRQLNEGPGAGVEFKFSDAEFEENEVNDVDAIVLRTKSGAPSQALDPEAMVPFSKPKTFTYTVHNLTIQSAMDGATIQNAGRIEVDINMQKLVNVMFEEHVWSDEGLDISEVEFEVLSLSVSDYMHGAGFIRSNIPYDIDISKDHRERPLVDIEVCSDIGSSIIAIDYFDGGAAFFPSEATKAAYNSLDDPDKDPDEYYG